MSSQANVPLAPGYQLLDYRIDKVLSSGGFSIVYLATDPEGNQVAIKEYLPSGIALRVDGSSIKIEAPEHQATFRHGLKCFFEEGRALAKIRHPNIVQVENFFRANETVYLVMQYVRGRTLQFHVKSNRNQFTEQFMRRFFSNFLNALREVHTHKLLHLDIKPANIYVNMDGTPVLLDFGAARLGLEEEKTRLKPMYTAGFAAPEQYRQDGKLGPWTDIYSVGATMYSCLAGTPPQAADDRLKQDRVIPATSQWKDYFSQDFLDIIDWCMRINLDHRPQSAFALQKALVRHHAPPPKPSLITHIKRRIIKRITENDSKSDGKNEGVNEKEE
ncbi:MAG TPA: serine/threonine-protein kinase [Burkholderiales bacterium]|nr:serine/threonine-protein kinase [Burkholderiales bacterium]